MLPFRSLSRACETVTDRSIETQNQDFFVRSMLSGYLKCKAHMPSRLDEPYLIYVVWTEIDLNLSSETVLPIFFTLFTATRRMQMRHTVTSTNLNLCKSNLQSVVL
jgi:hypothetical protein